MIIDNPIVSGSLNVQNNVTASNGLITNNLTVEGTIYGAISGSSATASYVEYENVANKPTLVSSSAQLAGEISGSFTSLSSSLSTRLTDDEGSISSLNAASSSYLLNTTDTLTGDLTVTGTLTAQDLVVQEVTSSIIFSSGSNRFGNELTNSHNFTGSVNITGSLNVNGAEVGTGKLDETVFNAYTSSTDTRLDNLEATGSDQESRIDTLEGKTLISSSVQIGTEISGAFTDASSSFSSRVTDLESFSSSLDATFATDSDLNLVSASVDNILAATSSYALSASISGAFTSVSSSIAADIEDIIDGTTTVASASHAVSSLTASYALNAGAGAGFPFSGSAIITGSLEVSGSTISGSFIGDGSGLTGITVSSTNTVTSSFSSTGSVTILHSFNSKNVSVSVYDDNDILIIPQQVTLLDNNNIKIDFGGNTTGFAVLAKGGHLVSGSVPVPQLSTVTDSFTSTTSHTVTHNFGTKEVIVSVYENDELIIPDSITTPTTDTVTVSFPEAISGRVVVVKAGHIVSGSIPYSNLLNNPLISGSGAITASGHLIPSENETYDLGSSTKRWRDIYLSSASIYLGNTVITEGNIVTTGSLSGSLPAGVISGSAQIATEISGAFTSVSSSFASGRLKNTTDTLTGDLTVTGTITAQEFHTEFVSASIIYESGSTKFGDTSDDVHQFTGSVYIKGDTQLDGKTTLTDSGYFIGSSTYGFRFNSAADDSNNVIFYDNGTSYFSGSVGIGTTVTPSRLTVKSSGNGTYPFRVTNTSDNLIGGVYQTSGGAGQFYLYDSSQNENVKISPIDTSHFNGGNVGIGTSSPTDYLEIRPNDGGDTRYIRTHFTGSAAYNNASNNTEEKVASGLRFGWYSDYWQVGAARGGSTDIDGLIFSRNGTEVLVLHESGNVGIGTNNVTTKLTVKGSGTVAKFDSDQSYVDFLLQNSSNTGYVNLDGNAMRFYVGGGSGSDIAMVMLNDGSIGIGTTSPGSSLDVVSNAGGNGVSIRTRSNNDWGWLIYNSYDNSERLGEIGINRTAASTGNIYFNTPNGGSALTRMFIKADGNIGIGTTDPGQKLHIHGAIRLTDNPSVTGDGASAQFWNQSGVGPTIAGNAFQVQINGTTPALHIKNDGNVGIGTINAEEGLHVYNTATSGDIRIGGGNGAGNSRVFIAANGNSSYIDSYGDNEYKHLSIQANRLLLNTAANTGNVGINTTAPRAKFEVAGDVLFRDDEINLYTDTSTAAQWVKIYEKDSAATVDYLHFELKTYNNAEFSAEVKIHVGSYSGFSTGYGNLTNGQGINCDIIHAGLNSQTNILESIVEVADLGSTSTYTKIYLKIDPVYANTVVTVRNYADATKLVETTNTWSTTDPSTGLYTRSFPFIKNNRSINNVLNVGSNGNVGIGGSGSSSRLYITNGATPYSTPNDLLAIKRDTTNANDDSSRASISLSNLSNGFTLAYGGTTDRFRIIDGGNSERLSVLNGGSVGIGTTSPKANLDVNEDLRVNRYHKNIFKYHTTASGTNQYFHIKTGVGTNQVCMHMYHVEGYAYGQGAILDERFGFHTDSGGSVYGKSYKGTYANNIYKSSDSKVVIVFGPVNIYYTSFMVHLIESGMYTELFVKPTAATYSSSNSGAY